MPEFTCDKRCGHVFHSSEQKKIVKCPVCDRECYNIALIENGANFHYIHTVLKNIKIYGEEGIFKAIDRNFHKAEQRVRVRKIYVDVIKQLKED